VQLNAIAGFTENIDYDIDAVVINTANIPEKGQALAVDSMPVVLTAEQVSTLTPPAAISGFATSANQDTFIIELYILNGAMAMRTDDVGSGVIYQGWANPGTATSAASWRIKKIVDTTGDFAITFADGNRNFDNVWDNRASLTYT